MVLDVARNDVGFRCGFVSVIMFSTTNSQCVMLTLLVPQSSLSVVAIIVVVDHYAT